MTVSELIEKLKEFPGDHRVAAWSESNYPHPGRLSILKPEEWPALDGTVVLKETYEDGSEVETDEEE